MSAPARRKSFSPELVWPIAPKHLNHFSLAELAVLFPSELLLLSVAVPELAYGLPSRAAKHLKYRATILCEGLVMKTSALAIELIVLAFEYL